MRTSVRRVARSERRARDGVSAGLGVAARVSASATLEPTGTVGAASRGERARAAAVLLPLMFLFAAAVCRLVHLQVDENPARAALVVRRTERQLVEAPPRGRILDRRGRVLAEDLPVFEVRAEVYFAAASGSDEQTSLVTQATELAGDLTEGLLAEGLADTAHRVGQRRILIGRIADAMAAARERGGSARAQRRVDFLVDDGVRSAAVIEALAGIARRPRWTALHLHLTTRYERVYPGGEACLGPVGFIADRDCKTELRTRLEALDGLRGGAPAKRTIRVGPRKRCYWDGEETPGQEPSSVITTLDLDLQHAAQAELEQAVAYAKAERGSEPSWGALVLAEVKTGDVLAMASWVAGSHPRAAAFTPIQYRFEPGSVIKPLVFAVAMNRGLIDWHHEQIDCSDGARGRGWVVTPFDHDVPRGTRRIFDDHPSGTLTPHEVLVRSSNVGAVRLGLRLGVSGLEDYVRTFGFGRATELGLLGEASGSCKTDLAQLSKKQFWYYTGASYCFGYEMTVTPVQMLRAYLSLVARGPRELRLLRGAMVAGEPVEFPLRAGADRQILGAEQFELLSSAMAGVVSDDEHATGRHVAQMLAKLGIAPGVIGGKTGTSVDRRTQIRTASFAGYAPVTAPRYVAFCVLQKDRAEGFYGGRYAAPAAARLLLHALGVLDPKGETAADAVRAQQVRAVAPERRPVTSAELSIGR